LFKANKHQLNETMSLKSQ